ncbi:MAG: hypothetical protein KKF33_00200 [Alphaproteobacteria bacterium]|nr:hypothetical protein [Alphaproteobacteria bacterium]
MQSINLAWFSRLANSLRPLAMGTYDIDNAAELLGNARGFLEILGDKSQFPLLLDASRPLVWALQAEIEGALSSLDRGGEALENFAQHKAAILDVSARLNGLLDADLAHQPVYHVFPKRAYDVGILTSDATQIFSPQVRASLNEEETFNLKEAGRCLAFEVSTAAGFHIFRALDSILQRYVRIAKGSLPKNRNWGQYIKTLEESGVDKKITSVLFQIKEFHRNPIVHPDERLDTEGALSLIGIAESALSMMVADMEIRTSSASLLDERDAMGLPPKK